MHHTVYCVCAESSLPFAAVVTTASVGVAVVTVSEVVTSSTTVVIISDCMVVTSATA